LITEIILGKAPVEPETALQLSRVLPVDAATWMSLEANYRLHLAQEKEVQVLEESVPWAMSFPVKALCARGWIAPRERGTDLVVELLNFFGAGTVAGYRNRFDELLTANFRTSPTYENQLESLVAWLRIGELAAEHINPEEFDREEFRKTLHLIRPLTRVPVEEALPELTRLCAKAGVAFVFEPQLGKIAMSGASRWLSPRRALIQQTGRYKRDDHFWFTFFHECAHLLLHSRRQVYVDVQLGKGSATVAQENEANDWAAEFLVPYGELKKFIRRFDGSSEDQVIAFAEEIGVSPGIVVGQLHHRKLLEFREMNDLRRPFAVEDALSVAKALVPNTYYISHNNSDEKCFA
jgi:hypothetical protein